MSGQATPPAPRRGLRLALLVPLALFLLLAAVFLLQLLSGRDAATIPSALIGRPAPETALPPVEGLGLPGLDSAAFRGNVTLVNVFASWCVPCRDEHPLLVGLAKDRRFRLVGLNYKDRPENARALLAELGNPYAAVGADPRGREGIEWGVYGVPETFLVGRDGTILFKQVGPLTADSLAKGLMPAVEEALAP